MYQEFHLWIWADVFTSYIVTFRYGPYTHFYAVPPMVEFSFEICLN